VQLMMFWHKDENRELDITTAELIIFNNI